MDPIAFPIVMTLVVFGLPIVAWIVKMYFAHQERMALIARGLDPRAARVGTPPAPGPRRFAAWDEHQYADAGAQRNLYRGIILAAIGMALFVGLSFIGYESHGGPFDSPRIEPGPWLLGGLIPMFVGIAQMIVALISGAQIGRGRPPGRGYGGGEGGAASDPPGPYPGGAGTPLEKMARPPTPPAPRM